MDNALAHLSANDPVMAGLIARYPRPTLRKHRNYYQELVSSIISQQLSVKAAATIERRFVDLFAGTFPIPEQIVAADIETLRSAGLSRAKAQYVQDLARHVLDGSVQFDHLDDLSNDAIITELTAVKGIGEWTVHMFLIFCMGRLDVLPTGDLGIRNGVAKLYDYPAPASPADVRTIADTFNWHPYESVTSLYVWSSLDNAP